VKSILLKKLLAFVEHLPEGTIVRVPGDSRDAVSLVLTIDEVTRKPVVIVH
jgi:hypothetical protein